VILTTTGPRRFRWTTLWPHFRADTTAHPRLPRSGSPPGACCKIWAKDLLLSRFLVGGKTANHAVRELERQCKAQGFSVGRTARFGIGVLSYFLLGRHLQVDTRRSIEAGDRDGVGWTFTSQGLDDFGELRKNLVCGKGTMVTLTVRGSVMKSGYSQFAESLHDYIEQTVRRVPCHFSFEVTDSELLPLVFEPGWAESEDRLRRVALKELRQRRSASASVELLPREEQERFSEEDSYWKEIRERAGDALFFLQRTGELPEGLGVYRLTLSRFQIGDEKSLAYLELSDRDGDRCIEKIDNQDAHLPSQEVVTSWNGMDVQGGAQYVYGYARTSVGREPSNIFLEVDWTSDAAGRLAVDRNSVQFSQAADKAIEDLLAEANSNLQELIEESPTSPIAFLNARMLSLPPPTENLVIWPTGRESRLEPLVAPLRCMDILDSSDGEETLLWRGREVRATRPIVVNRRDTPRHLVHWNGRLFRPLGIGFRSGPWGKPSVIWSLDRLESEPVLPGDLSVEFPRSWSDVFAFQTPTDLIWNRNHPLVQHIDEDSWEWAKTITRSQDPLKIEAAILSSSGRTAAWVATHVRTGSPDIWRGLIERREDFLRAVWDRIGLKSEEAVRFLACRRDTAELRCAEPHTFVLPGNRKSTAWLRETTLDLGDRWWLTAADTAAGAGSAADDQ
jgi:hypothetical protein